MKETLKANLRDRDQPPSLDNIDFESALYLKRLGSESHFEFGKYDPRDGSVSVAVELPDPPVVNLPESQAEWQERRGWYLKHSGNYNTTALEGFCWGYLSDEDAEWMGFPNSIDEYELESDHIRELESLEWEEEGKRNRSVNVRMFLDKGKRITPRFIGKVREFKDKIYDGQQWTLEDFGKIGFRIPKELDESEEIVYVLKTLDTFLDHVGTVNQSAGVLAEMIEASGLEKSLIKLAKQNPWQVYSILKQAYCSTETSIVDYNRRVEEIIFALKL